jgi:two-component system, OmpR family, sensor histidine kinase CiaH
MGEMFTSASFKLTAWYLVILITICLLFSGVIYTIASGELNNRLSFVEQDSHIRFMPGVNNSQFDDFRDDQVAIAERNLVGSLFITNIIIWTIGGIGSFYLARRTLQPIEEAHTTQSRFVSDASHELRTPLAVMKTELEVVLRDKNAPKQDIRDVLESNLEEVNKLSRLSHLLLELSRPDKTNIKKERIELDAIIKSAVKQFDKSGKRITLTPHPQVLFVLANRESMEELITILIDNALKYSPDDSIVNIVLSLQSNKVRFAISNNGKGIAEKDLPHIFDRFYRADNARTSGSGYGLGLSLAKKIVEMNNGDLSVTSGENQLTTFVVSISSLNESKAKIKKN